MFILYLLILRLSRMPSVQYNLELSPKEAVDTNRTSVIFLIIPFLIFCYFIYFSHNKISEIAEIPIEENTEDPDEEIKPVQIE